MSLPVEPEVVVIDENDDTEKQEIRKRSHGSVAAVPAKTSAEEEEDTSKTAAVATLQQILPHCSKRSIVEQLRLCQGNLEEAANRLLMMPQKHHATDPQTKKKSGTQPCKKKRSRQLFLHPHTVAAATTTAKTNTTQQTQPPTKRRLFLNPGTQQNHEQTSYAQAAALPKEEVEEFDKLCPKWQECYHRGLREKQIFVDSEFPPVFSSLDGRLREPQQHETKDDDSSTTLKEPVVQYCRCGLPAAARQVQSDGPNYGRFYLCCGQMLRQKRLPAVVSIVVRRSSTSPPSQQEAKGSDSPRKQPCQFFQWDKDGAANTGYASSTQRFGLLGWHAFAGISPSSSADNGLCCLYKHAIGPEQVQQGAIGNCWFISALAVVAEKPYLVEKLLPHKLLNHVGVYQINLCLDGTWQEVIVDSHLPVIHRDVSETKNTLGRKRREGIPLLNRPGIIAVPAFSATPQGQLWPALVEKAYAKSHGSYQQLSGGFIAEGLSDLTGAPCETVLFEKVDLDFFWARLLSFVQTGFCMGVATTGRSAQQGLVSSHAYSVLDAIQLNNVVVGEQSKLTDYFGSDKGSPGSRERKKETVRLMRIRNPWGTREWKGNWSAKSIQWTQKLRQRLPDSWKQGDGTFFMSFEDMLRSFHHMDICKTQPGWYHTTEVGAWDPNRDPLCSTRDYYRLAAKETTNAFISIVQPKKRSNTKTAYWYADPSLVVLRRKIGTASWTEVTSCSLSGIQRSLTLEMFLEPTLFEYLCVPFSCGAQHEATPFRLVVYSAKSVSITGIPASSMAKFALPSAIDGIHRHLFRNEKKMVYTLAQKAVLVCSLIEGGCYFVGLNASSHYVSLRLSIECPPGILTMFGDTNAPVLDIPPGTQKILCILSGSGKSSSTATQFPFRYISSVETSTGNPVTAIPTSNFMRSALHLCTEGEALVQTAIGEAPLVGCRGEDTVDTYSWIPQIGSFATTSSIEQPGVSTRKRDPSHSKKFKAHANSTNVMSTSKMLVSLISLCVIPGMVGAKRKRPAPKRTVIEGRKLRDFCETQICGAYIPEENLNCISVCLSPACFQEVYGETPLEDGELDFARAKLFDECFMEEIRNARQRKKQAEL